ncbi:hypothetical protein FNJ88_01320 [Chryseobacterium sp. SNU WT5]|nr:hypothetical protein FNJ88_01320 [Chryseobacterium sp. SNU WT5]
MKVCKIVFLFLFCTHSAQRILPFDTLKLAETKEILVDDYGNVYLYKNKDFSFTKYDSLGQQKARLKLTLPFKIQSVQNPLNISSFSENAQELRFFDRNLNEIQTVDLRQNFGFIKLAFVEDLQQAWLVDESSKRIVQYNFRDNRQVGSYPFFEDLTNVVDFLVFNQKFYFLYPKQLKVFDMKGNTLDSYEVTKPRKLRRENNRILVINRCSVQMINGSLLTDLFRTENIQFVDKNSSSYFVIKDNNLYLYRPKEKDDKGLD